MSNYSDDERAAILEKAKAILARPMLGADRPHADTDAFLANLRRQREAEREPVPQLRDWPLTDSEAARLKAEIHQAIADAVTAEREHWTALLPELLGLREKEMIDKISEAVGQLRAETNVHRIIDKANNITELPSFLRNHDSADAA
jgi:formate dehydrogenase maturation protein FdhE